MSHKRFWVKKFQYVNKINRDVQRVPQSQTADNPWHQDEEKMDSSIFPPMESKKISNDQDLKQSDPLKLKGK